MIDGPFRGDQALARGLLTHNELYGPRYRRLLPGVFAPSDLPLSPVVRCRAAYLLVEPRGGVLAGYSAALLLGADCAPARAPAEVLVPRYLRSRPGLVARYGTMTESDLAHARGCRVTSAFRTAWDLARREPLVRAVVAVDALARAGGFAPDELLARRAVTAGARGCRRLDEVVALADPRAESPPESALRLALVQAGLPAPAVQYRVLDEHGYVLARIDLAYPHIKLAIEYDGANHFTARRGRADRQRDSLLAGYGWLTVRVIDDDMDTLPQTVQRIRGLLATRAAA